MGAIALALSNGEVMPQSNSFDASVGQVYHNSEANLTTIFMGLFDGSEYLGSASLVVDHSAESGAPTVRYLPQKRRWENRPGVVSDQSRIYFTRERPGPSDDNCEVVSFDRELANEEVVFSAGTGCSVIGSVTIDDVDYVLTNQQHPKKRNFFGFGQSKRNVSIMVLKVPNDGPAEVICDSDGEYANSTGFLVVPGRGFVKAVNPAGDGVVPDPSMFLAFKPSDLLDNTYSVFQSELEALSYVLGDNDIGSARTIISERNSKTLDVSPYSPYLEQKLVSEPEDGDTSFAVIRDGFAVRNFKIGFDLRGTAVALPFRSPINEPVPFSVHQYQGSIPFKYERRGALDLSGIEEFISR